MAEISRKGKRELELEKDGWVRQTTYDEPRLGELVETYRDMGLEVRLEPPDPVELCDSCLKGSEGSLKTIYTRERKEKTGPQK
jgi:hypothetical protein